MINILHTEIFVQDKVEDARKDTDTHHFGSHCRTNAQGYRDCADCDPLVSINTFDNDSTTTSTNDLGAAIPEATHRLALFRIFSFVNNSCSLSFCSQVRAEISFLVMFSEDVLHVIVDL